MTENMRFFAAHDIITRVIVAAIISGIIKDAANTASTRYRGYPSIISEVVQEYPWRKSF